MYCVVKGGLWVEAGGRAGWQQRFSNSSQHQHQQSASASAVSISINTPVQQFSMQHGSFQRRSALHSRPTTTHPTGRAHGKGGDGSRANFKCPTPLEEGTLGAEGQRRMDSQACIAIAILVHVKSKPRIYSFISFRFPRYLHARTTANDTELQSASCPVGSYQRRCGT